MSKLNDAAKKVAINGGLMSGRTSIKCSEIVEKFTQPIHITGIGQSKYDGATLYIFTFAEAPARYFSAGKVLTEKTDLLVEAYDGDLAELNKDLGNEYLELYLSKKRGEKFMYINAQFGKAVPVKKIGADAVDEETGEVLNSTPF